MDNQGIPRIASKRSSRSNRRKESFPLRVSNLKFNTSERFGTRKVEPFANLTINSETIAELSTCRSNGFTTSERTKLFEAPVSTRARSARGSPSTSSSITMSLVGRPTLVSVELTCASSCTIGPGFSCSTVLRESIIWPVGRAAPTGHCRFLLDHHVHQHFHCLDGCLNVTPALVPYIHKKDVPSFDIYGNACCSCSDRSALLKWPKDP